MKRADWNRTRLEALYRFDLSVALASGLDEILIAGCDEAGRGALAGPACVACVSIDLTAKELVDSLIGVDDSKRLTPKRRAELFAKIGQVASIGIGWAAPAEIDRIGIVPALRNAARRAYATLGNEVDLLLLDRGLTLLSDLEIERLSELKIERLSDLTIERFAPSIPRSPNPSITQFPDHSITQSFNLPITRSFTRGDSKSLHIAAASIIAKVTRDRLMERLDQLVPGYGFSRHKGYGTAAHRASIARLGRSPIHRRSFKVK